MTMDEIASKALWEANSVREVKYWLRKAEMYRRAAEEAHFTWRDRRCPGCGHALKLRTSEIAEQTLFLCPSCGWNKTFPFAMQEGRPVGEPYIPGVTGKPRGRVVVTLGPDGKIRRVK